MVQLRGGKRKDRAAEVDGMVFSALFVQPPGEHVPMRRYGNVGVSARQVTYTTQHSIEEPGVNELTLTDRFRT